MQVEVLEYPTGERCDGCGQPQFFVPHYLVKREDGSRYWTTARSTLHQETCPTLALNSDAA